ncbi:MAG TPA: polyphosphate:AMP phosphotransferase [Vicinamibacterales bacterium]|jgi:polyphosphate:AMP phosphotransferase
MFEAAELGRKISSEDYKAKVPALRQELLDAQTMLREARRAPVIVLFGGVDGAGKSESVNLLNEWLDPRWLVTRAYGEPSDEERERPEYWRFWRDLPPRGRIGFFLSAWYSRPLVDRVHRRLNRGEFRARLDEIVDFERALTDDGAVILKFWMHLDKQAQKARLKKLEKDPLTRWRVRREEWDNWKLYGEFIDAAEEIIRRTSLANAPWMLVEGADERYRSLTIATTIRDAIRKRLADSPAGAAAAPKPAAREQQSGVRAPAKASAASRRSQPTILSRLDMSQKVDQKEYRTKLERLQGRLNTLHRKAKRRGISSILVFEGWDAAGKGGAVRRLTAAIDARDYQVIPIAAPTEEERAQHYLWRFWRHLARRGRVTIFDRSWYGRVLVERVEGFAAEHEWMRAYPEINQFESQLVGHGIVVAKFWMHITQDEQLRRFRSRESEAFKRWKLTDEDWRNRKQWPAYEQAVNDMVERTSTREAPWTLVEANDKYYARLKVLSTLCDRLEEQLDS